jgi:hypothetical protein
MHFSERAERDVMRREALQVSYCRCHAFTAEAVERPYEQSRWTDPETGYIRRQIAPAPGSDIPLDVVQVELPAAASVTFPARNYASVRQLICMSDGCLTFLEGEVAHTLSAGDCLELGPPTDCTFRNDQSDPCRYVVIVLRLGR